MWAVPSSPLQPHQETEQRPALPKPGLSKPKWGSAPLGREDPGLDGEDGGLWEPFLEPRSMVRCGARPQKPFSSGQEMGAGGSTETGLAGKGSVQLKREGGGEGSLLLVWLSSQVGGWAGGEPPPGSRGTLRRINVGAGGRQAGEDSLGGMGQVSEGDTGELGGETGELEGDR